jgi:signal transduction histidine kinase
MDDSQTSPSGTLHVVATGVDAALEKLLGAAALRASVACEPAVAEADALRQIESQAAQLAVVGDAPSGSTVEAMALAERLARVAAPVPILLIPHSPVAATDGLRLAARGIDVLDASALDIDALARRFLLHADAWTREERGRRAHALLRTQEALIAGLVHDLRTPLMAINLSAEVASVRSPEEVVQQAMRRIRSSTQRMARALDHLSNVARRDAQIPPDAREAADLGHLARAALDAVRHEYAAAEFDVVEHGDLRLHAHPEALQQALAHLLSTAAAHAQGDRIGVRIDGSTADRLWFEVTTPRAIPPDMQERLLGPPRGRAGREQPGLGLGLHAIEAVVLAHGGSVVGRSKAPDGTVFELLLPRDADD